MGRQLQQILFQGVHFFVRRRYAAITPATQHAIAGELSVTRCAHSPLASDLSASTSYTIVVLTLSGLIYSSSSENYFTTVAPSTVPTPPRDLTVDNITSTSAFFSWTAPVSPGSTPVTGYDVFLLYALHPPSSADPALFTDPSVVSWLRSWGSEGSALTISATSYSAAGSLLS